MLTLDYSARAELFGGRTFRRPGHLSYRRFESAAEAIQFAVEEMRPDSLAGALLEVEEERFDGADIRALYEADDYPLRRRSR